MQFTIFLVAGILIFNSDYYIFNTSKKCLSPNHSKISFLLETILLIILGNTYSGDHEW